MRSERVGVLVQIVFIVSCDVGRQSNNPSVVELWSTDMPSSAYTPCSIFHTLGVGK